MLRGVVNFRVCVGGLLRPVVNRGGGLHCEDPPSDCRPWLVSSRVPKTCRSMLSILLTLPNGESSATGRVDLCRAPRTLR